MILILPFVSRALGLSAGVGGAWIGTSEFADAAGFAAASAYGKMAGNEDAAIKAFTLMKVIGRDLWIGIWSLVWALIATVVWEKQETGARPERYGNLVTFPQVCHRFFYRVHPDDHGDEQLFRGRIQSDGKTRPDFSRWSRCAPGRLSFPS